MSFASNHLKAERLESIRGDRILFRDLEIQLHSGQILRVEGKNGAGKTTLLRILSGIGFASEGQVFWNEKKLSDCREDYHSNLHFLGHQDSIKMALTPLENLTFFQSLHQQTTNEKNILQALLHFGLHEQVDLPCASLSAGQKRRVALCRLLLVKKSLWILDEPFTALDDQSIDLLEQIMFDHIQQNGLLILTTHQAIRSQQLDYDSLLLHGDLA